MSSYFGLFTFTPPGGGGGGGGGGSGSPDLTPPVTTLGFNGALASTAGAAGIINEQSSVTLTAIDTGVDVGIPEIIALGRLCSVPQLNDTKDDS